MTEPVASELRDLAIRLIEGRSERGKVDFKRDLLLSTVEQKVEFCKDLSAIANTDDERLDGYGFIIVGAEPGNLRGGATAWATAKEDNFSAALTDIVKNYVAPVPLFSFVAFNDPDIGRWGIISIPPSSSQPHILIKEYSGNPAKHEWFVRLNDTTERAGVLDYSRVIQRATHRATKPLETEVQRLSLRVERLEGTGLTPTQLLQALKASPQDYRGTPDDTLGDSVSSATSLPALVRNELSTSASRIEDLLAEEALRIRAIMIEDREENPQLIKSDASTELMRPIEYMETHTRSFAEAIAAVARHDASLKFSPAVLEAFEVIAEQPELTGEHWVHAEDLRLYPFLLSLYGLAFVCAGRNDGRLLRKVLDRNFRIDRRDQEVPIIWALRAGRGANDLFNGALKQRYFEPLAMRLASVIPSWCGHLIPGRDLERVFYQAEFAFALEHMRMVTVFQGSGIPLSGAYLYANKGQSAVLSMLKRRSPFLTDLFGEKLEGLLETFDTNVNKVISREAFGRTFSEKTRPAWLGTSDDAG